MISIIITAFREPAVGRAIDAILTQRIPEEFELIVAAPDTETEKLVSDYKNKFPQIRYFKDPGKGKSFALNLLFKEARGEIMIFTDGDVYFHENAVENILKCFSNENVGIAFGRPVPTNSKDSMLGYWAHLLMEAGAHSIRQERAERGEFLEGTAYLMGVRRGIIDEIPLDVAEDSMMPYLVMKKGWRIAYAGDAKVFVKSPDNFTDFVKQRVRTAKAHETLTKYAPDFPRVKTFSNEILEGWHRALSYPKTPRELLWTLALFPARLYIWLRVKYEHACGKRYQDAWERVESTKK